MKHKIKRAVGNHPLVTTVNKLIDNVESCEILDDPTVNIQRGSNGTRISVKQQTIQRTSTTPQSSGMNFRGEWSATVSDYVFGDVVVIRGAIIAGTYVCIAAAPVGSNPSLGIYWVTISGGLGWL